MKLLLDQGLARSTADILSASGIPCVHVGTIGLADAEDAALLRYAAEQAAIIVTLDADFHALIARSGQSGPSVIRIRIEGLTAAPMVSLIRNVLTVCGDDLASGAVVTVTEKQIRVRRLPLRR